VKKVILLCTMLGALLWAVEPWTGTIDVGPWWVKDNAGVQQWHQYRGICVLNDSVAWVVGDTGEVYKRTDGLHSHAWTHVTTLPVGYTNYHFNDVFFINADTGWIVGEYKHSAGTHDTLRYRGVIYRTTDEGESWIPQTPSLSYIPYPTPFLKVQFVDGSDGYITCGNGMVIFTTNGGAEWYQTTSDPWNDTNNISVWYDGLHVLNSDSLWVSGDAFGIMSKSTNRGDTWTSYEPNEFKQTYTFPSGTNTPYDTRLANFDAQYGSMNSGFGLGVGSNLL